MTIQQIISVPEIVARAILNILYDLCLKQKLKKYAARFSEKGKMMFQNKNKIRRSIEIIQKLRGDIQEQLFLQGEIKYFKIDSIGYLLAALLFFIILLLFMWIFSKHITVLQFYSLGISMICLIFWFFVKSLYTKKQAIYYEGILKKSRQSNFTKKR